MSSAQQHLAELADWPDAAIELPSGAPAIAARVQLGLDTDLHLRRLERPCIADDAQEIAGIEPVVAPLRSASPRVH